MQIGPVIASSSKNEVLSSWPRIMKSIARTVQNMILSVPDDVFRTLDKKLVQDIVNIVAINLRAPVRSKSREYSSKRSKQRVVIVEEDVIAQEVADSSLSDDQHVEAILRSARQFVQCADFRLPIAERLLKSQRLDMRLTGLNDIKIVLQQVQQQAYSSGKTFMQFHSETESWELGAIGGWEDAIR